MIIIEFIMDVGGINTIIWICRWDDRYQIDRIIQKHDSSFVLMRLTFDTFSLVFHDPHVCATFPSIVYYQHTIWRWCAQKIKIADSN